MNDEYLRSTIDLVGAIESRYLELGARLHKIFTEQLWKSSYDSYYEFLQVANINPATDSKLRQVHQIYRIDNNFPEEKINRLGWSKLYSAIPLIENKGIEKTIAMVQTLSKQELTEEVRENKHGVCQHLELKPERYAFCKTCGKLERVN